MPLLWHWYGNTAVYYVDRFWLTQTQLLSFGMLAEVIIGMNAAVPGFRTNAN